MKINNQKKQFIFPYISTYNYNNLSIDNICECDKPSKNNNVINNISEAVSMKEDIGKQFEIEKKGMQVILEFPVKQMNKECVMHEVQPILAKILQEHLKQIS